MVTRNASKIRDLFGLYVPVCRQKILSLAIMHGPVTCSAVLQSNSGLTQSDETTYLHGVYAICTNII